MYLYYHWKLLCNSIAPGVMYNENEQYLHITFVFDFKFSYTVYEANVATKQNTGVSTVRTIDHMFLKIENFLNPSEVLTIYRILLPKQLHFDESIAQWKTFINYRIISLRWELNQTICVFFHLINFQLIFIDWNHALNVEKKEWKCKPERKQKHQWPTKTIFYA